MTSKEAELKYGITIPNKIFFDKLTEREQLEIIEMRLNIHNETLNLFKEFAYDK